MFTHIEQYKNRGYVPIASNGSGIGAEVLVHRALNRVVKFGQDAAYDVFVSHAIPHSSRHYPAFYFHDRPAGSFVKGSSEPYTVTEMEVLNALSPDEEVAVAKWFSDLIACLQANGDPQSVSDPFGLTSTFLELQQIAIQNGLSLDMMKTANYMVRLDGMNRVIVVTDPFM